MTAPANLATNRKFPLGQLVVTAAINEWMNEANTWANLQHAAFIQHQSGDWGDVCKEDWDSNDQALINGSRLLSSYTIKERKVWIITEWDRSVTTILFPEDY